ncbi:efflux RND transporter periplasmic adaptor subunit [Massilia timonae]|uniref:Efflux transporter, RND family, MFP subunit n=1 Tax=Massilia timonae TaxID=47229 RepID=A0A1S2NHK7_9BURK|nr:efflux RND transporter periplasmic adaptor subunit [Massilia timonae]OIJ44204.1 efflux transporter, RND family, MFP subunit [Massilia timonae]
MPSTTSSRRRQPALGAAALAALLLSACAKDPKPVTPTVPEVAVLTMNTSNVALNIALPGRTAPFLLAEVRARVDGIVQERRFREGADVKSGEPLYLIDPAPYRAALASAEAELQRAQATLASNTSQLKRNQVLVKENAVSKQEFENAEAAQLEAAADVAAAKAAVESARINLGYTSVSAPITGRSSVSAVTQGAYVQGSAATLMTTIQQIDPMYVDLQQSSVDGLLLRREIAAGRVRMDGANAARVSLTLEDGSTYARSGTLEFSGVTVDQATGAVTLRARFPNPDKLLLPGMFVRASVSQGVRQSVMRVPAPAVSRTPQGTATVMIVDRENKAQLRTVRTGALVDGYWLIDEGLKEGERVVVSGTQKLRPGTVVRIGAPSAPASQAPAAPASAAANTATAAARQG